MYFTVAFVCWPGFKIKTIWIDGNGSNTFVRFLDDEKYIHVCLKNTNSRLNTSKYYRNVMTNVIVMPFNEVEMAF